MKSVLVIMQDFAPNNNCGSIPNTKLIKYLAREDVKITLITDAITPEMVIDPKLVPAEADRIEIIHIPHSGLYNKTLGKTREKITNNGIKLKMKSETRPLRAKIVTKIKNVFFRLRGRDWMRSAKKIIRRVFKGRHFDVIYSTYPDTPAHYLAKYLMQCKYADKWIADFRDPIGYAEYDKYEYIKDQMTQHAFERAADIVTIVSEGAMEKFLCDGVDSSKIIYMPNGYDPEDFDAVPLGTAPAGDRFRIFYAGTLYAGKRDLTPMFRAISELKEEGKIDASKISVEYAGNEWPIMLSFAEKYGLESLCTNYGYITRHQVMEIMGGIDCSVVSTHNTKADKGVVTGKIFELLLVGKPIIALVGGDEPGSELGNIVKQCSAGAVCEQANGEEDFEAFKQWIKEKYDEKMRDGKLNSALKVNEREKYSYKNIAHRLYEIIERAAK